jgi:hypothetical protein
MIIESPTIQKKQGGYIEIPKLLSHGWFHPSPADQGIISYFVFFLWLYVLGVWGHTAQTSDNVSSVTPISTQVCLYSLHISTQLCPWKMVKEKDGLKNCGHSEALCLIAVWPSYSEAKMIGNNTGLFCSSSLSLSHVLDYTPRPAAFSEAQHW